MPYFRPAVDYEPHNFNSTIVTVNSPDLDAAHVIEELDTIEVELKEDRWSTFEVNSGASIHVHNPKSRAGTIKLTALDASASIDVLNTLADSDSPVTISVKDANAPNLDCSSSQARVQKHAMVKRSGDPDVPEWVFVCTRMTAKGGGYRIQNVS